MLSIYLLFFTFKVVATLMCAVYCYRIARLDLTPTFTYMLFVTAFVLRLLTQVRAAFYTREIVALWDGYGPTQLLVNQAVEVVIVACFLIGILRKYHGFRDMLRRVPTS